MGLARALSAPESGCLDKASAPEGSEAHLRSVESQVQAVGITDCDAAFANAGKSPADDDGLVFDRDDQRFQHDAGGFARLGALGEILPQGIALPAPGSPPSTSGRAVRPSGQKLGMTVRGEKRCGCVR